MRRLVAHGLAVILLFPAATGLTEAAAPTGMPCCTVPVTEDTDYHQIALEISPEEFYRLGFRYGDGCDIRFANGKEIKNIPYYNGFYTRTGEPLLVAYPGFDHVQIALNNGDPSWMFYDCHEGDTVTVTLAEAGKYLEIQDALDTSYSNDRADYPDDASFANFRPMTGGRLRKDTFYRGASPVNNAYNRAACVDGLLRDTGIRFVLDLADSEEKLRKYAEVSQPEYLLSLNKEGLVVPLGLTASYLTDDFRTSLAAGLREMMKHEGPYYIHCLEGKDRTGFVCMLLEALSGASEAELEADYMKTYAEYYGINPGTKRYDAIFSTKFQDLLDILLESGQGDAETGAKVYLKQAGMTEQEVVRLVSFILTGQFSE